jgi:hypothetical protein
VLVGGVRDVHVSGAIHDAGHPSETNEEAHVGAIGHALDGRLLPCSQLVGVFYCFADRGVGGYFGRSELSLSLTAPACS